MQKNEINCELANAGSEVLAKEAVRILLSKKAQNVKLFDVRNTSSVTDFYINVTGLSTTHVASLADDFADLMGQKGASCERIEGRRGNSWILVDYLSVIVNVFDKQSREFYNLDRHFSEGSIVDIAELGADVDNN